MTLKSPCQSCIVPVVDEMEIVKKSTILPVDYHEIRIQVNFVESHITY